MFKINANDITYVTTHRGVNAFAPIRDEEGLEVGSIDDKAEAIVASVRFITPAVQAKFLEAATEWAPTTVSEEMRISEYARYLLAEAEDAYLATLGQ
jgi:hypothetical protein